MRHAVAAIAVMALLGFAAPVFAADGAQVGKPAPAFVLKDESGAVHSLDKYKGKIVVLEWTNPNCPFVVRHYEADTMDKTQKASDASKVVWLAVNSTADNTADASKEWKKKEGFGYPVLQDAAGTVGKSYGAKTTPHMFVVDQKGVLQYSGAIDDDARGTNKTPVNHVLNAVKALQDGKAVPTATTPPYGCSVKYKSS